MAINQISNSNTIQQLLIATQGLITVANTLTDGNGNKFIANTILEISGIGSTLIVNNQTTLNTLTVNAITSNALTLNVISSNIITVNTTVSNTITANTITVSSIANLQNLNVSQNVNVTNNLNVSNVTTLGGTLVTNKNYINKHEYISIVSNAATINLSNASVFTINLDSNLSTITLTNYPVTNDVVNFVLVIKYDGIPRSISWPNSFRWSKNVAPTLVSEIDKVDIFTFFSYDQGNNWFSIISGQQI